jgi:hypothetical protein
MLMRPVRLVMAAALLLAVLACTEKPGSTLEPPPPAPGVSFTADIQPLFARYGCTGCHGSPGNSGFSVLTHESVFGPGFEAVSIGMLEVVAARPDTSYLIWKLEGAGPDGESIIGQRMPRGGAPMATADIELLRAWITEGALDN